MSDNPSKLLLSHLDLLTAIDCSLPVLDLACGTGRNGLVLAMQGMDWNYLPGLAESNLPHAFASVFFEDAQAAALHRRILRQAEMRLESFNGRFRDECLNENWFMSMQDARKIIEDWRIDYNQERPHSGLDYLTPEEFIQKERDKESTAIAVDSLSNNAGNSNYHWYNKRG